MSYPIIPPLELVQQWCDPRVTKLMHFSEEDLAARAAQWGADQELEACCEWLEQKVLLQHQHDVVPALRTARRPEQPSLKEQALAALHGADDQGLTHEDVVTIRRALEQLP